MDRAHSSFYMDRTHSSFYWAIFILIIVGMIVFIFPYYQNVSKQLTQSKAQNIASALSTLVASNYTLRKSKHHHGVSITNCKDVTRINGASLPNGYSIENQAIASDELTECNLTTPRLATPVKFSVIGIS